MKKSFWMPIAFLLAGAAFYVYYGITYNAWGPNLPNLLIYVAIVVALFFAQRKKEKLRREREEMDRNS